MQCPKCEGKGYKIVTATFGGDLRSIKQWCEKCSGTGQVKYEGDRSDVA